MTDLLVTSVKNQSFDLAKLPLAPPLELLVEKLGGSAHLHGADRRSAQLLRDRLHPASRHALQIHLGHRELESPFTLDPALQGRRVERFLGVSHLRNLENEFAHPTLHRLGFEPVRISRSLFCSLVRGGTQESTPFDLHRLVEEDLERCPHSFHPVFGYRFHRGFHRRRIFSVGHVIVLLVGVLLQQQETRHGLPLQVPTSDADRTQRAFTETMMH